MSGGNENPYELFFWNTQNYNLQKKLSGHQNYVNFIIKLKKENFFSSCGEDKKIIIWNNMSQWRNYTHDNPIKKICNLESDKIIGVDSVKKIFVSIMRIVINYLLLVLFILLR